MLDGNGEEEAGGQSLFKMVMRRREGEKAYWLQHVAECY